MAEEEVLWEGRPSHISNLHNYIIYILISVGTFGFGLIFAGPMMLWTYLVVRSMKYKLTTERLITSTGVLNVTEDELELYRVHDARVSYPLFLRLFGLGNIEIVTTDHTTSWIQIRAIPDAKEVREAVRTHVEKRRAATETRELEVS